MSFFRNLGKYDIRQSASTFRPLLFRYAQYEFTNYCRYNAVTGRTAASLFNEEYGIDGNDALIDLNTSTPLETCIHEEDISECHNIWYTLPIEEREILRMAHDENMTHEEIGIVLGISKVTVYKRLAKARKRIRNIMQSPDIPSASQITPE